MKHFIIGAIAICLITQLNAQDFSFGFEMSPSFSWLSSDDNQITTEGRNLGLRLGVLGEYYFQDNYALVSGIGFAFRQGGTLEHKIGGDFWRNSELSPPDDSLHFLPDGSNLKYKIQYLEIPFSLKMRTNEFGYFRYFAEIPMLTFGFRTQGRGDVSGGKNSENQKINDDVNMVTVSWGLGVGLEYSINSDTRFVGGLYFRQGFIDVTDDDAVKIQYDMAGQPVLAQEDSKSVIGSLTLRLAVLF